MEPLFNQTFTWLFRIDWIQYITAAFILVIGVIIAYLIKRLVFKTSIRLLPREASTILSRLVYYGLVIVFVISAFSTLGIDLTGLVIAGGIVGIILGFAFQSVTANLVSGLFLYWERPLKPGDLIEVEDHVGRVVDISIMSTKIITWDGVLVRVPNRKIFESTIKNYEKTPVRRIEFTASIAYKEDAEKAYKVIRDVIEKHPLVLVNPEPDIYVSELGDSGVNIKVRVWVPSKNMLWYEAAKDLLWRIKKALSSAGIEIPFPQQDIWFRTPLEIKLMDQYKSKT